jgi:hypothetical protein
MSEYYRLISRAVAALEINTFEDRRAIYNRARSVQSQQLGERRFNKADFDRERLMLEDAISRVETEATTDRITTEASPSAPETMPTDLTPSNMHWHRWFAWRPVIVQSRDSFARAADMAPIRRTKMD